MDYDAIDRDMSSWVVTTEYKGRRLYLTGTGLYSSTDALGGAQRFRWEDQAETAATMARLHDWRSFDWQPSRVAAESAR